LKLFYVKGEVGGSESDGGGEFNSKVY
jgi:hypothetical protein